MKISLSTSELKEFIGRQLEAFFPDKYLFRGKDIDTSMNLALERVEYCFKHVAYNTYHVDSETYFSHLNSDQYSQFLYFFSNSLWTNSQNKPICDKLILLNKMLNGMFVTYKCCLPAIFLFIHPVGTVIGNAIYDNYLVFESNVTINTTKDGINTPKIGKGVFFSTGATIIGDKIIGDRSSIGARTLIFNKEVPQDSIALTREDGSLNIIKRKKPCMAQFFFNVPI
ncbi:serine O-acetyltransferase [Sporomusaceae bacterium BoRhaA]|uniref:hypothetical protein n=1 Tax=Pelorhabdus rhamnosifermentans TaxID=2772457 RepID=UPI001C060523|nr:hypothetical protein [Pelorhabdus rhamnosifermentans]MBU2703212.1 serine O-acetyltransferase [Pelorhabdus rhamnosifermentans]